MKKYTFQILILLALFLIPTGAFAQNLSFQVEEMDVHAYWNEDGSLAIDYYIVFVNDPGGDPIDFVDIGLPNTNYQIRSIFAEINGQPVTSIEHSDYLPPGVSGVAIGLGPRAIQPGSSGELRVYVGAVQRVLYPDSQDDGYASARFATTYFDRKFTRGSTRITVTYHLPPGVQPEEPRWHSAPPGWPAQPETGFDSDGRIVYVWSNTNANAYTPYEFGASFPVQYVPDNSIVRAPAVIAPRISLESLVPLLCMGFFAFIVVLGVLSNRSRKMQYLPPKISIEGHGIKRGLTAVEAAILMEQSLDKILTMILFAVVKKNAARVVKREPLEIEIMEPPPANLHPYEKEFLEAFSKPAGAARRQALQKMMINLVKSVSQKMKGFSRRETISYYRDIVQRAWNQVEQSETPEVKSEKFDEVIEWTMLDRDYDRRTREVFREGPVFVPVWWPRYDPGFGRGAARPSTTASPIPVSAPAPTPAPTGRGGVSLPHLPGADFAASIAGGVQNFSSSVIGNLADFTSGITNITNPPPPPSRSTVSRGSGGTGCACACACACAGCACACAGGGR